MEAIRVSEETVNAAACWIMERVGCRSVGVYESWKHGCRGKLQGFEFNIRGSGRLYVPLGYILVYREDRLGVFSPDEVQAESIDVYRKLLRDEAGRRTDFGEKLHQVEQANPDWAHDVVLAEIGVERRRQVSEEGWSAEHDDKHVDGEIARAAASYAAHASVPENTDFQIDVAGYTRREGAAAKFRIGYFTPIMALWPWHGRWFKPKSRRDSLIKAAALIVAEIERLDRLANKPEPERCDCIQSFVKDAKDRAARGEYPANDVAYCQCGNMWVPEAFAEPDICPDCGGDPIHVEKKQEG